MRTAWGQQKPALGARLLAGHPLAVGLESGWLLNESGGQRALDVASGRTGSATSVGWVPGRTGVAANFNGSSSVIAVSPAYSTYPAALSISAWFRAASGETGYQPIVELSDSGGIRTGIFLDVTSGAAAVITSNAAASCEFQAVSGGANLNDGKWHHLVGIWAGESSRSLYLDGSLQTLGSTTSGGTGTASLYRIGDFTATGFHFNGDIESVYVWNRVISGGEVAELYRSPYSFIVPPRRHARNLAVAQSGQPTMRRWGGSIMRTGAQRIGRSW